MPLAPGDTATMVVSQGDGAYLGQVVSWSISRSSATRCGVRTPSLNAGERRPVTGDLSLGCLVAGDVSLGYLVARNMSLGCLVISDGSLGCLVARNMSLGYVVIRDMSLGYLVPKNVSLW